MRRVTHDGLRWSNGEDDRIEIADYDPAWPTRFADEAAALRNVLPPDLDVAIEHFGSTAIAGLAAKPIIDIMLIVPARSRWSELVEPVQSLGYVHWGENPAPHHMFFVKGMPPFGTGRTHHVHVHRPEEASASIRFRDYLIAHPDEAARYAALKRELAQRFRTDRDAYTNHKAAFVAEILAKTVEGGAASPPGSAGVG
jgi:GrpB-like predicted nucleotidyltransferase (UPF0157 family)